MTSAGNYTKKPFDVWKWTRAYVLLKTDVVADNHKRSLIIIKKSFLSPKQHTYFVYIPISLNLKLKILITLHLINNE
jgi:hypothetical protein